MYLDKFIFLFSTLRNFKNTQQADYGCLNRSNRYVNQKVMFIPILVYYQKSIANVRKWDKKNVTT